MPLLKALCFIFLDLGFTLFAVLFVNWWAPLFADDNGYLPNWLKWVGTFDDTLDAGYRDGLYKTKGFFSRVRWLYRNPGYGFSYYALGYDFSVQHWAVVKFTQVPDFYFYAKDTSGYFNIHCVKFGLRFKFGWKAWNMYDPLTNQWHDYPWGATYRIPFCFTISLA